MTGPRNIWTILYRCQTVDGFCIVALFVPRYLIVWSCFYAEQKINVFVFYNKRTFFEKICHCSFCKERSEQVSQLFALPTVLFATWMCDNDPVTISTADTRTLNVSPTRGRAKHLFCVRSILSCPAAKTLIRGQTWRKPSCRQQRKREAETCCFFSVGSD